MNCFAKFFSNKNGEILNFFNMFYNNNNEMLRNIDYNTLELQIDFPNPVAISDILGVFIDNIDNFSITMWISLDKDILINVTKNNANEIIKYLFERYPY